MINHVRTLLLNMSALPGNIPYYEEYIPPEFTPMVYSANVAKLRESLVPAATSRADSCFRVYGILSVIQAPDFEPYVLALDPRLTYDISNSKYISANLPRSSYPGFSITDSFNVFNGLMMNSGQSIFNGAARYPETMALFKTVWFGNNDTKSRLAAGALAVVYNMEAERQNAIQS